MNNLTSYFFVLHCILENWCVALGIASNKNQRYVLLVPIKSMLLYVEIIVKKQNNIKKLFFIDVDSLLFAQFILIFLSAADQ